MQKLRKFLLKQCEQPINSSSFSENLSQLKTGIHTGGHHPPYEIS